MVERYYSEKLAAERLRKVYDLAPPRIKQYLQAEIDYVLGLIPPGASVLELGCGFGRVLAPLTDRAETVCGIDTSLASLRLARLDLAERDNLCLACMDASRMAFRDESFDLTVCIQNGISAFHVDPTGLVREAARVTRPGGLVLFSSYSEKFWEVRLDWFERQAQLGLVGEIDYERTGHGRLVCKDGFTATTFDPEAFWRATAGLDAGVTLVEVDRSSLFCVIRQCV